MCDTIIDGGCRMWSSCGLVSGSYLASFGYNPGPNGGEKACFKVNVPGWNDS